MFTDDKGSASSKKGDSGKNDNTIKEQNPMVNIVNYARTKDDAQWASSHGAFSQFDLFNMLKDLAENPNRSGPQAGQDIEPEQAS